MFVHPSQAISGAYLLVSFQSPITREGAARKEEVHENRLKVHRNTVFVIERETLVDSAWHQVLDVTDLLQTIPPGK